jgi:hypothetical protein
MKGVGITAAVAAVCGLLVVAAAALAKNVHYEGPVDQPQLDTYQKPPRIEFAVRYSKNKKGKLAPKSVPKLNAWNLWYQCEHPVPGTGDTSTIFYPNAINDSTSEVITGVEFPVKHRKFSTTSSDNGVVIEVSGALKGGGASGTVRLSESTEPGSGFDVGYCDSGPLSWTASKGN